MRLTVTQNKLICETAEKYFGSDVHVWLFGSRVNDNAKGGDIDLYIESTMQTAADLVMAKLQFLRDLHKTLGEQKIDVVLQRSGASADMPIHHIVKQTGLMLR